MPNAYEIITDTLLTYQQQVINLAKLGENTDTTIPYNPKFKKAIEQGDICDLFEGALPYRPRYIAPDYKILMEKGSKFLELDPPKDIWEATNALLIMYRRCSLLSLLFRSIWERLDEIVGSVYQ